MSVKPPVRAKPADPRTVEAHERIARAARPDGPYNAPPISRPGNDARPPFARPGGPPAAPVRFTPPQLAPPRAAPAAPVEAVDAAALRARATAAVAAQTSTATSASEAPDPGTVLASVPRTDGTQLRVSVHTYEGRPFVRVAPWASRDGGRSWWPVRGKGASVRVRELASVAAALLDALDAAAAGSNDAAQKPDNGTR